MIIVKTFEYDPKQNHVHKHIFYHEDIKVMLEYMAMLSKRVVDAGKFYFEVDSITEINPEWTINIKEQFKD